MIDLEPRFMLVVPDDENTLIELMRHGDSPGNAIGKYGSSGPTVVRNCRGGISIHWGASQPYRHNHRAHYLAQQLEVRDEYQGPVAITGLGINKAFEMLQIMHGLREVAEL